MSTLKNGDLISLQSRLSITFIEESTDSLSAPKPIAAVSKYSEKQGGSEGGVCGKTLNFHRVLWEELKH